MAENQQPTNNTVTDTLETVYSYPLGIKESSGAWGYDKWMLFSVMNGRHILRTRGGLDGDAGEKPVPGAPQLCLYLPPSALQSEINLDWAPDDYGRILGTFMQSVASNAETAQNALNTLKKFGQGSSIGETVGDLGKLIGRVGSSTAKATIIDFAQEAVESVLGDNTVTKIGGAFGQTPNPRTDIFFNSVKYRTHSFTWKLIPRNAAEAKVIDVILNTFQFYSLPSFEGSTDDKNKDSDYFIGYPYEWSVQMFSETAGRGKHHINTIDRSVVTRVNINHASNDRVAFIVDGEMRYYPVDTTLTVDMHEVRLQGRNDQDVIWRGLSDEGSDKRPNTSEKSDSRWARYPDPQKPLV